MKMHAIFLKINSYQHILLYDLTAPSYKHPPSPQHHISVMVSPRDVKGHCQGDYQMSVSYAERENIDKTCQVWWEWLYLG